jgi:hypothetical protein
MCSVFEDLLNDLCKNTVNDQRQTIPVLQNGKHILTDLYSSPSIIRIIKSRRMRWAGHVARMGEKRNAYRLLMVKPEGKNH